MRGKIVFSLICVVLLIAPLSAEESDGFSFRDYIDNEWVYLTEVCPTGTEFFTIKNYSAHPVDLTSYSVTDGEGTITFTEPLVLDSFKEVSIITGEPEPWMDISNHIVIGNGGVKKTGNFTLADSGDDLYLKKGDTTVDYLAWGTVYNGDWNGPGVKSIPKKSMALRTEYFKDGAKAYEWAVYIPGMSQFTNIRAYENANVIPFSFPESDGSEIIWALQGAEKEVYISIYTISHPGIGAVICYLLEKGVRVNILIEGSPAGGIPVEEIQLLTALHRAGAEIYVIKSNDGYKRYPYLHTKYALVDDDKTIITSENWTESSFQSNRGWGCIITNNGMCQRIKSMFDSDLNVNLLDIYDFISLYPTAVPSKIDKHTPVQMEPKSYTANVTPVMSPDYSYDTLVSFLSDAKSRIYSQQLNVEYDWISGGDNPLSVMESLGSKGVDSRLLVDVSFDSQFDENYRDGFGLFTHYYDNPNLNVKYEESKEFSMAHNKGIVKDDSVWIGSMNWTENSITRNRELSVIIDCKEIADYYAGLFARDWNCGFSGEISLDVTVPEGNYGEKLTLDASVSSVPYGSVFEWDLDGDGQYDRTGIKTSWKFYKQSDCTLKVTDPEGNEYSHHFSVDLAHEETKEKKTESGFLSGPVKYVPLIIVCAIIIGLKRFKART